MLLLAADSSPQALHEAHKLITQSYSPETLYALDNFEVSTQYEYSWAYTPNDHTTVWAYSLIDPVPTLFSSIKGKYFAWPIASMHAWVAQGHMYAFYSYTPLFIR